HHHTPTLFPYTSLFRSWIHAQHDVAVFQLLRNLPHLDVNFVADGVHRFHVPSRLAIRTRGSNGALQRLFHAFARNRHQAEVVKRSEEHTSELQSRFELV